MIEAGRKLVDDLTPLLKDNGVALRLSDAGLVDQGRQDARPAPARSAETYRFVRKELGVARLKPRACRPAARDRPRGVFELCARSASAAFGRVWFSRLAGVGAPCRRLQSLEAAICASWRGEASKLRSSGVVRGSCSASAIVRPQPAGLDELQPAAFRLAPTARRARPRADARPLRSRLRRPPRRRRDPARPGPGGGRWRALVRLEADLDGARPARPDGPLPQAGGRSAGSTSGGRSGAASRC